MRDVCDSYREEKSFKRKDTSTNELTPEYSPVTTKYCTYPEAPFEYEKAIKLIDSLRCEANRTSKYCFLNKKE